MIKCSKGEVEVSGTKSQILAEFTIIVRALRGCEHIKDEEIRKSFDRGFESEEELNEQAAAKVADFLTKIAELMKEGGEQKGEGTE